jgi:hypothetical protein
VSPEQLVEKYCNKGILIDTNLLVLLVTGVYRRERVSTFNRTRQYTLEDFDLLVDLIRRFRRRIVTPHILAEADNLTRQMPRSEHRGIATAMRDLLSELLEIYIRSTNAAQHERFADLGLADCTIIEASNDMLVLTDDFRLSNILPYIGRDALNHIRTLDWS